MRSGWVLAFCLALSVLIGAATAPTSAPTASTAPTVLSAAAVIALHGTIDDYSRDKLFRHVAQAKALGAKTVILDIDTFGGLVTSGLEISQFIKGQNDLHIIALVNRKAISAGAMIALSCNEIVMVRGGMMGDCAPIVFRDDGTVQSLGETERQKSESPILADFKDSASRNGYNVPLVLSMVSINPVYDVERSDGSERKFVAVSDERYKEMLSAGWKAPLGVTNPVYRSDTLLTVNDTRATELGLAKEVVGSRDDLIASRQYNVLASMEPSVGDNIVGILSSAAVRAILLVIFLQALYIAFSSPGHGAAEAICVVTLGMLLGVPLLTGYAQWYEILIILAGLALVAFEIFVFPGHFVSAIVGLVMIIGGLVMTFVPKEPGGLPGVLPSFSGTYAALRTGTVVVVGGLTCSLFLWLWLSRYLPHLPYFNRLILSATSPTPVPQAGDVESLAAGAFPAIGSVGVAITDLRPGGSAKFPDPATGDTRIADVVSESGYIAANTKIAVRSLRGSYAVVRSA